MSSQQHLQKVLENAVFPNAAPNAALVINLDINPRG